MTKKRSSEFLKDEMKIFTGLWVYLSIYLSVCLSVCLSIHLSVYISVFLSVSMSDYLSVYLSVCVIGYLASDLSYLSSYIWLCYLCSFILTVLHSHTPYHFLSRTLVHTRCLSPTRVVIRSVALSVSFHISA